MPDSSVLPPAGPAFFVATNGRDGWSGRLASPNADGTDGPFATLERARDAMRADDTVDVTYVRGGTYALGKALELGAPDSGVTIAAYPGETPVLSGGERITGFRDEGGGLFSAAAAMPTDIELSIGGVRQRVAQSGAWDPADPFTSGWLVAGTAGAADALTFREGDVTPAMIQPGMKIQAFDTRHWADSLLEIESVDYTARTIRFAGDAGYAIDTGGTYRLLNNDDLIRDAGEFGWSAEDGRLFVKPEDPAGFEAAGVVVPRLAALVRITDATGITVRGLTFADTPHNGNAVRLIRGGEHIVADNRFTNVGTAVTMGDSDGNRIAGNRMEHLGYVGINIGGGSAGNTITGNTIDDIGVIRKHAAGILSSGMTDTLISRNDISHSARYGIAVLNTGPGTESARNTIEHNRITHTAQETGDAGAISFLGRSDTDMRTVIRGNFIDGVGGLATDAAGRWVERHLTSGIYLDDRTNGVTVTENFVRDTGRASVFIHGGDHIVVTNNIGILRAEQEDFISVYTQPNAGASGLPLDNAITGNIVYAAAPVGTYWKLGTAVSQTIEGNLVHNVQTLAVGDLAGDPGFLDMAADDFRLGGDSAAFALGIHDLPWTWMGAGGSGAVPPDNKPPDNSGNDRLTGGAGDETLDGGAGVDVVRLQGKAAEHAVTRNADGTVTVADLRAGGQGTDLLKDVELIRFDDGVRLAAIPAGPVTVFDEALYLAANPDVAGAVQAGMFVSGLQHFQQFGWAEGRHALLTVDEAFYRAQNPDVDAAIEAGVFRSAAEHFILSGLQEGRTPNALFDTGYYLAQNADVAAAVQAGVTTAYGHYCLYGWTEGRDPSPWFDTSEYLKRNPDVAVLGTNPLSHLLDFGLREGRLAPAADDGLWP